MHHIEKNIKEKLRVGQKKVEDDLEDGGKKLEILVMKCVVRRWHDYENFYE